MADTEPNTIRIDKKITGYAVVKPDHVDDAESHVEQPKVNLLDVELPKRGSGPLAGLTYKVSNPTSDVPAIYCTCNFIEIEKDKFRLAEIFIRGNGQDDLQYVTFIAKMLSALCRKTGRIGFMLDEMIQTPCEIGGYRSKLSATDAKPRFFKSQISHIGAAIEDACMRFGLLDKDGFTTEAYGDTGPHIPLFTGHKMKDEPAEEVLTASEAQLGTSDCKKCGGEKTVVLSGGCDVCLDCGNSEKCQ